MSTSTNVHQNLEDTYERLDEIEHIVCVKTFVGSAAQCLVFIRLTEDYNFKTNRMSRHGQIFDGSGQCRSYKTRNQNRRI